MENCIFCKIVSGDIPSMKVYEDENCIAILDINPAVSGHTLVIPKTHYRDITEVPEEMLGKLFAVAKEIGKKQLANLGADGFNVLQNNGAAAGQTVLHFHIHVIPRFSGDMAVPVWTPQQPDTETLREIAEKLRV